MARPEAADLVTVSGCAGERGSGPSDNGMGHKLPTARPAFERSTPTWNPDLWIYGAGERRQMPGSRLGCFVICRSAWADDVDRVCNPLIRRAAEMDRQLLFFSTIEKLPDVSREPSDGG